MKVKLNILVDKNSVRLYGNRDFFRYLQQRLEHLISCPEGGYCEFQTVALGGDQIDLTERASYVVLKMPEGGETIEDAEIINIDDYDVVFMTVEDQDFVEKQA